jgi:hypothetical protein
MLRAKFQVTKVAKTLTPNQVEVTLGPQYDTSIEEGQRLSRSAPIGQISLYIDNPDAADFLTLGKFVYIDISDLSAKRAAA